MILMKWLYTAAAAVSQSEDTYLALFHVSTLAKSEEFCLPVKKMYSPSFEALLCEEKKKDP